VSVVPALAGSGFGKSIGLDITENMLDTFLYAFVAVALSEEFAKYLFLRFVMFNKTAFNEPFDGIIYAVMIGMGFAAFENVLYVAEGGVSVAVLRAFTAVPAHAAFGVIMGFYVGLAKFNPDNRQRLLLTGLFWAVVAHGAYDFFIMQQNYELLGLLTLIVLIYIIRLSRQAIAIHQKASPFNPDNQPLSKFSFSLPKGVTFARGLNKADKSDTTMPPSLPDVEEHNTIIPPPPPQDPNKDNRRDWGV
ncbi:MAG TPA: PrsW family glutamic-type intramembrane protease, partial [Chitinophagales bacterium]|nr:PrsW family glutamic-type intramembrane protease [Chitinophagales bacterium]